MNVTVVWATSSLQDIVEVDLPVGATTADAAARSGLVARYGLDMAGLAYAIFGKRARADAALSPGDRVELTRPLAADPKVARARRARASPLAKPARRIKHPG
jgi:putative ubiquitin-RnfH superfamily antitoxin RatB of RatAB toxin-antitoxin module